MKILKQNWELGIVLALVVANLVWICRPRESGLIQSPIALPHRSQVGGVDSVKYWKAKYDSVYGVWTEAREKFFLKKDGKGKGKKKY